MPKDYLFVSCDIVAHSAETNLTVQQEHLVSINQIIADILNNSQVAGIVWASGGDGGHLAFPAGQNLHLTFELIVKLRSWSQQSGVPLRISASGGPVETIEGADGRIQLVGHGINLAGRLLALGGPSEVIVTQSFYEQVASILPAEARLHDKRTVKVKNFNTQEVYLLSVKDLFDSAWDDLPVISDRLLAQQALERNDFLEVIYRSRRLLEVNSADTEAINALHTLALNKIRPQSGDNFLNDLLLDIEFGFEVINAGTLIERRKGEILCDYNDEGETMFFILKGRIGVFFPKGGSQNTLEMAPDFVVSQGELTGEIAFELRRRRTATLLCLEETAILAFSYDEILKAFTEPGAREQITVILNRKILTRLLENLWNTAPYLCNKQKSGALATPAAPWLTLLPFSKIITVSWHPGLLQTRDIFSGDTSLAILLSGQVQANEDAGYPMDGVEFPILYTNFPGMFNSQPADYRLLGSIKLLVIHKDGLLKLERVIYNEVTNRIRNHLGDAVRSGELSKESQLKKKNGGDKKHIFISYCRENKDAVYALREKLVANNFSVWWDQDIPAGQPWKLAIRQAMKHSYAIIFCLSAESQARIESGIYPEISDAIAAFRNYSQESIFLIPVRLSLCEIPSIEIDATRTLDDLQYVDLFPTSGQAEGMKKLIRSLEIARGE